jgi:hypothetical protein
LDEPGGGYPGTFQVVNAVSQSRLIVLNGINKISYYDDFI